MFISKTYWTNKSGKTYPSIWLKETYRENGKVKARYIINLKDWSDEAINALQAALNACNETNNISSNNNTNPDNSSLIQLDPQHISLEQGLSVGALLTVHQVATRLGIVDAIGNDFQAKLALWQIYARVIEQGSRLSAARMANLHAVAPILQFSKSFNENNLYKNLKWLNENE